MNNDTLIPPESQQSTVTNWKEIDLSTYKGLTALIHIIAEREGWQPEQRADGWIWRNGDRKWTAPERENKSAESVWRYLVINTDLFDYLENTDTAITLITSKHLFLRLDYDWNTAADKQWKATVEYDMLHKGSAKAATPAMAISLAWLAWYDTMGGQS